MYLKNIQFVKVCLLIGRDHWWHEEGSEGLFLAYFNIFLKIMSVWMFLVDTVAKHTSHVEGKYCRFAATKHLTQKTYIIRL